MCIHMFLSPSMVFPLVYCVSLQLASCQMQAKASLHLFISPFLSSSFTLLVCVFHTSVAFASPALWTQILSLGLGCQGELSLSSASLCLRKLEAHWTQQAGLESLKTWLPKWKSCSTFTQVEVKLMSYLGKSEKLAHATTPNPLNVSLFFLGILVIF